MAFEALKKDIVDVDTDMRSYLKNSEEYLKLKTFKVLMKSVTAGAQTAVVGAILLIALFMLSLGASLAINEAFDSFYYGFMITGLFFIVIAILCYFFRGALNRPLLRKFSKHYFDRP
ncbi:hypothetical protein [Maribacter sp. 2307ULW6-5]|uniref:hypothetical protein n=1 Tax=Maribacter sp. 2307ULW6-5 TaxID=3386275 RepID=UPI0039BC7BDC